MLNDVLQIQLVHIIEAIFEFENSLTHQIFLDYDNEVIFKNKANLLEIDKFETKRFLGNLKIDENFSTCTIQIKN